MATLSRLHVTDHEWLPRRLHVSVKHWQRASEAVAPFVQLLSTWGRIKHCPTGVSVASGSVLPQRTFIVPVLEMRRWQLSEAKCVVSDH